MYSFTSSDSVHSEYYEHNVAYSGSDYNEHPIAYPDHSAFPGPPNDNFYSDAYVYPAAAYSDFDACVDPPSYSSAITNDQWFDHAQHSHVPIQNCDAPFGETMMQILQRMEASMQRRESSIQDLNNQMEQLASIVNTLQSEIIISTNEVNSTTDNATTQWSDMEIYVPTPDPDLEIEEHSGPHGNDLIVECEDEHSSDFVHDNDFPILQDSYTCLACTEFEMCNSCHNKFFNVVVDSDFVECNDEHVSNLLSDCESVHNSDYPTLQESYTCHECTESNMCSSCMNIFLDDLHSAVHIDVDKSDASLLEPSVSHTTDFELKILPDLVHDSDCSLTKEPYTCHACTKSLMCDSCIDEFLKANFVICDADSIVKEPESINLYGAEYIPATESPSVLQANVLKLNCANLEDHEELPNIVPISLGDYQEDKTRKRRKRHKKDLPLSNKFHKDVVEFDFLPP